jgi:hypothetical protein
MESKHIKKSVIETITNLFVVFENKKAVWWKKNI